MLLFQEMHRIFTALALLISCAAMPGQTLNLGAVTGTSVTGDFQSGSYFFPGGTIPDGQTTSSIYTVLPFSRSLIIGPKLELALPGGFTVEADALHRPLNSKQQIVELFSGGSKIDLGTFTQKHADWEFPILGRYEFSVSGLRPFAEAGVSLRPAGSGTNVSHWGVTAGGGIDLRIRGFAISPALRFTRWADQPGGVPLPIRNQVEILVGAERPSGADWAEGFGKRISIGVLAGVGLGDDLKTSSVPPPFASGERSDANSLIAGASLEVALHGRLSLEADGIYRPLHATNLGTEAGDIRFAVLTWEFPLMAKYRFGAARRWRPFLQAGPSFRLDGNFNGPMPSHYGAAGGTGIEVHLGKLKIAPGIRYTRWGADRSPAGRGVSRNEVQALAGLAF
jgi:hypothetical protein